MSSPNLWLCYGVTSPLPSHTNIGLRGVVTNSHYPQGCFSHLRSFQFMLATSVSLFGKGGLFFMRLNI